MPLSPTHPRSLSLTERSSVPSSMAAGAEATRGRREARSKWAALRRSSNGMIQREAEVKNKVTAVALTDSVHNVWHQEAGKTIREWMREVSLIACLKKVGLLGWPSWVHEHIHHSNIVPFGNCLSFSFLNHLGSMFFYCLLHKMGGSCCFVQICVRKGIHRPN
uniref:Uncharacterized protein n=1 Tax=Anolis carolinensis TaxID=28377 RepID=A0A803TZH3_ANOCA